MLTLSKIAELAHVSVSTVSKAFMGSSEVNEQTREQIFEIAKKKITASRNTIMSNIPNML